MNEINAKDGLCPECGKARGLPILWGKLSDEAAAKVARGEAMCGGCDIFGGTVCGTVMNRECPDCGHQWYLRNAEV